MKFTQPNISVLGGDKLVAVATLDVHSSSAEKQDKSVSGFMIESATNLAAWNSVEACDKQLLRSRYEAKLKSYDDNLLSFVVRTVPLLALGIPVKLAYQIAKKFAK
jgi:hypothetical protein